MVTVDYLLWTSIPKMVMSMRIDRHFLTMLDCYRRTLSYEDSKNSSDCDEIIADYSCCFLRVDRDLNLFYDSAHYFALHNFD
jgi:hypothetical protein